MSERVHSLNSTNPPTSTLFEPIRLPLIILLRHLHNKFVRSDMFAAFMNRCSSNESSEITPCSYQNAGIFFSHQDCERSFPVACSSDSYREHKSIKQMYDCDASSSRHVDDDVIERGNLSNNAENNLYREAKHMQEIYQKYFLCVFLLEITVEFVTQHQVMRRWRNTLDVSRRTKSDQVYLFLFFINWILLEWTLHILDSVSPVLFSYRPSKIPNPYGENGFAPPPNKSVQIYNFEDSIIPTAHGIHGSETMHGMEHCFTDSSGFCSAESAYLSEKSFGKGRSGKLFEINVVAFHNFSFVDFHQFSNAVSFSHTLLRKPQISAPSQSIFATLPRKPIDPLPIRITMVLRESDQPPMVAKVAGEYITLFQFRKTFGISRKDNKRLLFKSTCEDNSAPYQWSVIIDDNAVLPIFEGKITAECRRFYD
uniref:DIX domain-containing protein n=1 Tax=Heterorhabditis bacteriophora TaxID=37862 RepID=A0A1I7W7Q4_HETBA